MQMVEDSSISYANQDVNYLNELVSLNSWFKANKSSVNINNTIFYPYNKHVSYGKVKLGVNNNHFM